MGIQNQIFPLLPQVCALHKWLANMSERIGLCLCSWTCEAHEFSLKSWKYWPQLIPLFPFWHLGLSFVSLKTLLPKGNFWQRCKWCKFLCVHMFSVLLGKYIGVELESHMSILCLTFSGTARLFSKALAQFYIPICSVWGLQFLLILFYCLLFGTTVNSALYEKLLN